MGVSMLFLNHPVYRYIIYITSAGRWVHEAYYGVRVLFNIILMAIIKIFIVIVVVVDRFNLTIPATDEPCFYFFD